MSGLGHRIGTVLLAVPAYEDYIVIACMQLTSFDLYYTLWDEFVRHRVHEKSKCLVLHGRIN
jgi:hypothetical protein